MPISKQHSCCQAKSHHSKHPSFYNQHQKLYYEDSCKISICSFCLQQLLIQKQKIQEQAKGLHPLIQWMPTLQLPCRCKVTKKEIYKFLSLKCRLCGNDISVLSSAVPFQDGYDHSRCHRLSIYKSNLLIDAASIRNKSSPRRSVSFITPPTTETQNGSSVSKIQITINQPKFQLDSLDRSQRSIQQKDESLGVEHADQQFYPIRQWNLSLQVDNDLYIECHYCKYPLHRNKLYESHIVVQVQPVDDHLFCIRCMLYASGKLKTNTQLKQANKQQLKTQNQQITRKPHQNNIRYKGVSRIKLQQYKFANQKPQARVHANPLQASTLRRKERIKIFGQNVHVESIRKQILKKLISTNFNNH